MHIGGGLSRGGTGVRPMHLAEILASTREAPVVPGPPAGSGAHQEVAR
jgi:L-lactate dehydrogenase complex protein LldE